ncbi:MAG TPA: hypothetical protein PK523_10360, partial [Elusimicrobiales bacterium]|nr:hypothetical protein [Elusimicrobiales bacterium]
MPENPRFIQAYSSELRVQWDLAFPGDSAWAVISEDPSFAVWHTSEAYASGVGSAVYTSLSPGTTYYFKVKNAAEPDTEYTVPVSSAT